MKNTSCVPICSHEPILCRYQAETFVVLVVVVVAVVVVVVVVVVIIQGIEVYFHNT